MKRWPRPATACRVSSCARHRFSLRPRQVLWVHRRFDNLGKRLPRQIPLWRKSQGLSLWLSAGPGAIRVCLLVRRASSGPHATHASSSGPHETHAPARSRRRALSLAHAYFHTAMTCCSRPRRRRASRTRLRCASGSGSRARASAASGRRSGRSARAPSPARRQRCDAARRRFHAHDVVIRANQALVRGLEAHVGSRTDLRVWGFVPLPREKRYSHAEWAAEDNYIIYCPPIKWAGYCWNQIAVDADPRFHPSAWRRAQRLIHTNRTRCAHVGCYPSTGAMAVLHAVDRCQRVTVYGFGTNEAGVAERPSAECCVSGAAARRRAATRSPARWTRCQKYTPRLGEPSACCAPRLPEVVDGGATLTPRQGRYPVPRWPTIAEAAAHDVVQEWAAPRAPPAARRARVARPARRRPRVRRAPAPDGAVVELAGF